CRVESSKCLSLILKVFESACGGDGMKLESLRLVVGFAGCDHGVNNAREFVSDCGDAFCFAKSAFHAAAIVTHFASGASERPGREAQDVGHAVDDFACARSQDSAAGNAVIRA